MTFSHLAHSFDAIAKESSRIEITKLLANIFANSTVHEARHISYLALGTLRAQYQDNNFNFATKSIVKTIGKFIGVDFEAKVKEVGDVGAAIILVDWPYRDLGLSIESVYEQLIKIQEISGTGSQEEKGEQLIKLLMDLDALSASYVLRIMIGTMRLGFSDMTLIDSLSWMVVGNKSFHDVIENAYNLCADVGLITQNIKEHGIEGLKNINPQLGIPIRPAAAERASNAEEVIERLGPCVAQPKLDGFRLQIHLDRTGIEPKFWFYSRNLQDMSHMFPDLVNALKDLPVNTLIAEGEAIVYDVDTETFLPFQETVKRKRKHDIESVAESLPLKLFLFDILYVNNNIVMDKSHEQRRKILIDIFKDYAQEQVTVIEERYCSNAKELSDYLQQEINRGLEGLVVKRIDAIYRPGKRNFNWIKLKRHAVGNLSDNIDVVILGYYLGRGKRAEFGIGAFLVGIYNKNLDRFETIAKIGTGMSDEEWKALKTLCDEQKVQEKPHSVECAKNLYPDVWVNPTTPVIVLADEITQSPIHTSSYALRFPRFIGYSVDKTAQQATSIEEIIELFNAQFK